MGNKLKILVTSIVIILCLYSIVLAQNSAIENGVQWLESNQNTDYSWGDTTALESTRFVDTSEVISTFNILNINDTAYNNALNWLSSVVSDNNYISARRVIALSDSGIDLSQDLDRILNSLNEDGGWGGDYGHESMIIDTTFNLQALNSVNYFDQDAISYLIDNQNTDGGFGFYPGDESNVYMTAMVSMTLQQFSLTADLATAINKATDYLINQQQVDGSWGSIYETALAYIALVGVTTDATVLGNAVNYLTETQLTNGSWNDDPYSTALALRALYLSENKPPPPPEPTTGMVTGKVVDASTNQPLEEVSVVSGQLSATTTNTGDFTLSAERNIEKILSTSIVMTLSKMTGEFIRKNC